MSPIELELAGDRAILLRLGRDISPETHARVLAALAEMDRARPPWIVDVVPAYASLLVEYDAAVVDAAEVVSAVRAIVTTAGTTTAGTTTAGTSAAAAPSPMTSAVPGARQVEVPVWYHPTVGPDLEPLASEKGVTPAELIAWHTAGRYHVYALGFRPGFAFLGVVDPRLATPRLAAPRARVAAGSVGVAGQQTGIYPVDGPGGWRILGRTPLLVFDEARGDPFLLHVGDEVRFVAVDEQGFRNLEADTGRAG